MSAAYYEMYCLEIQNKGHLELDILLKDGFYFNELPCTGYFWKLQYNWQGNKWIQ